MLRSMAYQAYLLHRRVQLMSMSDMVYLIIHSAFCENLFSTVFIVKACRFGMVQGSLRVAHLIPWSTEDSPA